MSCIEFSRPRSLLVFVNPISGRGRSTRIYREKVAPLFELARVATEVIVTEKKHHAQNLLQEANLDSFDGSVTSCTQHISPLRLDHVPVTSAALLVILNY